jgi:type VI secretion system secreted protein VgrG
MGSHELKVAGGFTEVTGAQHAARIGGNASAHTAGEEEWVAVGPVGEACLGDRKDETEGGAELEAVGPVSWHAGKLVLQAEAFTLVVGGEEVLAIDSSGNVKVGAKSITVDGTTLALKGSKIDRSGAAGADQASPAVRQLKAQPGERAWIEIQLDDQDGKPVPNAWFRAEFSDGTVKEGRTGADGRAWVPGPKAGNVKVSFPGHEEKA